MKGWHVAILAIVGMGMLTLCLVFGGLALFLSVGGEPESRSYTFTIPMEEPTAIERGASAPAADQRVRLILADGEVVEGTLADYGSRIYSIRLDGGITREIGEDEVRKVEFIAKGKSRILR